MLIDSLKFIRPSREYREMELLAEVGRNAAVTQRALAKVAGVSATMVNAYIDDLVSRGCLEVTGDTNRTYRYHLTAEGRSRLDALLDDVAREVSVIHARVQEEVKRREAIEVIKSSAQTPAA